MQKIKNTILTLALLLLVLNPSLVMAQSNGNANNSTGGIGTQYTYKGVDQSISSYLCTPSNSPDGHDLQRCIIKLYRFGVGFGAIAVVFFIVLAGYMYITGGESAKTKAKGMIQNSLVGIAILLGSYLILSFINPNITIFKPIQPPIFEASDLPSCEALGLGTDCTLPIHSGGENVTSGTLPKGIATACKGGVIATPNSLPHTANASQICKDLADTLANLKSLTPGVSWVLGYTAVGTHRSSCHAPGNPNSYNCVDIDLNGGRSPSYDRTKGSTNPQWESLCKALTQIHNINFANEASSLPGCQNIKAFNPDDSSGPNLHVNYIGS